MIRLVVALRPEARPLIRHFGMDRVSNGGLRVWRGRQAWLVVSGIGRAAAAEATAGLARLSGAGEAAWLNVGIGGHRHLPVGEIVLAHKVAGGGGGRAWYPPLVFDPPCATATVTTVDRPEQEYPQDTVYEMEAAGFCAAAARHASAELIQVVKVVSDNAVEQLERLTAARVEELIAARLETIAAIAEQTAGLAAQLDGRRSPPRALAGFTGRWHFTVTQRRRLERLLRRLEVLEPACPEVAEYADRPSARAVLQALEERLAGHPPGLG